MTFPLGLSIVRYPSPCLKLLLGLAPTNSTLTTSPDFADFGCFNTAPNFFPGGGVSSHGFPAGDFGMMPVRSPAGWLESIDFPSFIATANSWNTCWKAGNWFSRKLLRPFVVLCLVFLWRCDVVAISVRISLHHYRSHVDAQGLRNCPAQAQARCDRGLKTERHQNQSTNSMDVERVGLLDHSWQVSQWQQHFFAAVNIRYIRWHGDFVESLDPRGSPRSPSFKPSAGSPPPSSCDEAAKAAPRIAGPSFPGFPSGVISHRPREWCNRPSGTARPLPFPYTSAKTAASNTIHHPLTKNLG